jgi:hypothetical protein
LADEETLANYLAFALGIVTMIIGTWNFYDLVQMTRCRRVDAPYRWQVATNRFMISRDSFCTRYGQWAISAAWSRLEGV